MESDHGGLEGIFSSLETDRSSLQQQLDAVQSRVVGVADGTSSGFSSVIPVDQGLVRDLIAGLRTELRLNLAAGQAATAHAVKVTAAALEDAKTTEQLTDRRR